MPSAANSAAPPVGRLIKRLCLLWLAGMAMRMTIMAMPPVIPLVHNELQMSETQVGLLIGLPLAVFAIAAVPGSLLIARVGAIRAVVAGMVIAAFAGGGRAAAVDIWTLDVAAIATGFGVAIMQPGLPTLVGEWLPGRAALGTIAYTSGMVIGSTLTPVLTIPFVLPLVGGSWRLGLLLWALPAILIVPVFLWLSPRSEVGRRPVGSVTGGAWWPHWNNPLIWLLGLTFGSNSSPYFATNAFLGDYLAGRGQAELLGPALGWLNGAQIAGLALTLVAAGRLERRAWPFLLFGPVMLAAFLALILIPSAVVIVGAVALIGLVTAVTMAATLTLPPVLCAPGEVARTAAGMFTISYASAIIIPTICGALWDATGKAWTTFVPLCVCSVTLTAFGAIAARLRPPEPGAGR